jgi:RNA polymerase sigma factor (sigma-70 family)
MSAVPAVGGDGGSREVDFATFYGVEYPNAVRLAFLLTRSDSVCEEIAQEAFADVYKRFENWERPAAYLRTTIVNACRRWHHRQAFLAERAYLLMPATSDQDLPGQDLVDVVARLPYRQRVVVVGRYWGGWSESEIAEVLDCPKGTVKSLASRALDQIRREIDRDDV